MPSSNNKKKNIHLLFYLFVMDIGGLQKKAVTSIAIDENKI